MDRWTDGQLDRWTDKQIDRWTHYSYRSFAPKFIVHGGLFFWQVPVDSKICPYNNSGGFFTQR